MSIKLKTAHFVKPYTFIIFIDPTDNKIKAVNNRTLAIAQEGTDFKTVISAVLSDNVRILIMSGVYNVSATIDLSGKKGVVIEGESAQWGHQLTDKGTVLRLSAGVDMFKIDNSALGEPQDNPVGIVFKGLQLDGNVRAGLTAGRGIYANYVGSLRIEGCHIHSFAESGLHLVYCMDVRIENCSIGGCDKTGSHTAANKSAGKWIPNLYGIQIDGGYCIWIRNNGIWHNVKSGIYIHNAVNKVTENIYIQGNNIVWNDEHGIFIERKTGSALYWLHIEGNTIDEEYYHGLYVKNTVASAWGINLFVVGNQFVSSNRAGAAVDTNFGVCIEGYSTTYTTQGIEIVGNIITDIFGRNQGTLKLLYVDGIRVTGVGMNRLPVMSDVVNQTLSQLTSPSAFGGLPYYTTLPASAPANSVILYYDGTNYKICAYLAGAWKCATLT